jgi:ribosomal protein S18 acetylase RimI-like enzyme
MTPPEDSGSAPVEIEVPEMDLAGTLTDLWIALADSQRAHGSHIYPEENRTQIREKVVRHAVDDAVLVARDDGIVGFVTFDIQTGVFEQDCARGIVENIFVRPERRGEGIGSALLAAAERRLTARGIDVISLEVMADNETAREFYRRAGYAPHRVKLEKPAESDTHSKDEK